jgi:hypothetical protein
MPVPDPVRSVVVASGSVLKLHLACHGRICDANKEQAKEHEEDGHHTEASDWRTLLASGTAMRLCILHLWLMALQEELARSWIPVD